MYDTIIVDDMKKEAKYALIPTIFLVLAGTLLPLVWFWDDSLDVAVDIKMSLLAICAAIYGLYVFLSCITYKLIVTCDKIVLKTLFIRWNIDFANISNYSYKKHRKFDIYIFLIRVNKKKFSINTRHPNKLIELLDAHDIPVVASKKTNHSHDIET